MKEIVCLSSTSAAKCSSFAVNIVTTAFVLFLLNVLRCQKHIRDKVTTADDDDELMLNVLRCHETY